VAAGRERGPRPRRVSLPGVAELLRPVGPGPATDSGREASGREAHPQKITVYLSADEFLDLERARLSLHIRGIRVDRGRLVREAIAVLMADLEAGIDASVIARRLRAVGQSVPAVAVPAAEVPAIAVPAIAVPAIAVPAIAVPAVGASVTGATVDGVPADDAHGVSLNGDAVTNTGPGGGPAGPQ